MSHPPTPQQAAIISSVLSGQHTAIYARAGCGKTSTLCMIAQALAEADAGAFGTALAFNVTVKDELKTRLPAAFEAVTINGFGHRAWMRHVPKRLDLQTRKQSNLLGNLLTTKNLRLTPEERDLTVSIWNYLRQVGAVPDGLQIKSFPLVPWDEAVDAAWDHVAEPRNFDVTAIVQMLAIASINAAFAGVIDFSDQTYMPVVFRAKFPQPGVLFVDEAQDLSSLNHEMIRLANPKQLVIVGDPKQAIYGFRGAHTESMDMLGEMWEFNCLPLTKTFRCGKAIVQNVRTHVPDFEAADTNSEGTVRSAPTWTLSDLNAPGTAILCRNNAPLVRVAMALLRNRIPCNILGRDISITLAADIKKAAKTNMPIGPTVAALRQFYADKIAAAPRLEDTLADREEIILAAGEGAGTRDELIALLKELFSSDPSSYITLATGHKAKGLEWDRVFHLDSWLIGRRRRGDTRPTPQESNIRYVIETRARHELVLIDSAGFAPE